MKQLILLLLLICTLLASAKRLKAEHVILIGLDGWGSYSMEKAEMPNVRQLMADGCYTLTKRAVLPSSSAVNWASMFMGAGPELHGYTEWGSKTPELPSRVVNKNGIFPTVFSLIREKYPKSDISCFYEWNGIKYVVDTLAMSCYEHIPDLTNNSETLCKRAEEYIKSNRPQMMAVIFDNPDHVGHHDGHNTEQYYSKLHELDDCIGRIVNAVKDAGIIDNTIFIVTADHGGINKNHGGKTMEEMETPFIIAGKSINRGGKIDDSMMQYDIASNIAYIFGIEQPQVWVGRHNKRFYK